MTGVISDDILCIDSYILHIMKGVIMKLKDFRKTEAFAKANIVEYYNQDRQEILLPTTQVKWRKLLNKEVIRCEFKTDSEKGLNIIELFIEI